MNPIVAFLLIVEWAILFVLSVCVDLIGIVVVPIALAFCDQYSEHLPLWAWPWDNDHDGINGDGQTGISGWRGPDHADGMQREFIWRYKWLAFRNPGNNFGYLLGRAPAGNFYKASTTDRVIGDQNGSAGAIFVCCDNCWCLYIIAPWFFAPSRCLRIAIGWKCWDCARTDAQIVGVINPFTQFTQG